HQLPEQARAKVPVEAEGVVFEPRGAFGRERAPKPPPKAPQEPRTDAALPGAQALRGHRRTERSAASYRPGEAPGGDANGGKDAERRPKALVVGHRLVDGVPERAQLQVSEPLVRCAERSMTKPGPRVAEGRAELGPPLQAIRRGPRPEERALVVVVEAAVLPPGVE